MRFLAPYAVFAALDSAGLPKPLSMGMKELKQEGIEGAD
jgi:hypothetical protein